ncbi:T-cell immunoglobulin and mucin domain-containing protein 4-like [Erpetoichthys calabaricus]|uniref:T-cell immunoglobulin and mucin domain-containing protein 4-like n=1 Tax=Erpetoichthys calabaricus TaxID=27687 RepID=UPI002234259A|nr:T-cell immunoglobulin and mucin domain-containing protein 4-like [Erpetoichthys calabaricus]
MWRVVMPACCLLLFLRSGEGLLVSEVSVTATVGHNVTLPCWYSVPLNRVRPFCWKRGDCPPTITFTLWCGSDEVYSEGDKVTRVSDKYQLTSDVQRGNLSLTVVNVSIEDSGPYCCRVDIQGVFNDQMSSVLLTVTAETSKESTVTPREDTTSETPTETSTATSPPSSPMENQTETTSQAGGLPTSARKSVTAPVMMVTCLVLLLIGLVSVLIYKPLTRGITLGMSHQQNELAFHQTKEQLQRQLQGTREKQQAGAGEQLGRGITGDTKRRTGQRAVSRSPHSGH